MPERVVLVELRAVTKNLQKGLKDADKRVSKLTKNFKRLGAALIAAFSARAVFQGFKRTLRDTEALIRTARGVGFATNEYRQLIFALDAVGVSSESARIALGDLQKRLSRPSFQKFFRDVGLEPEELLKQSRAEQLQTILERLNQLRDDPNLPGISGLLFEEQSGKDITKVVLQFQEFLDARKEYERIVGRGVTEEDEDAILGLNKEVKALKLAWEELRIQVVADSAPEIQETIKSLVDSGALQEILQITLDLTFAFSELTKDVRFFAEAVGSVKNAVPEWMRDLLVLASPAALVERASRLPFKALRESRLGSDISPILQGTNADPRRASPGQQGVNVNVTNNFFGVNERAMPGRVTDSINRELATP